MRLAERRVIVTCVSQRHSNEPSSRILRKELVARNRTAERRRAYGRRMKDEYELWNLTCVITINSSVTLQLFVLLRPHLTLNRRQRK